MPFGPYNVPEWCAVIIAAAAAAVATQFVATDATRNVQRHCRPERSHQMQECEYGGLPPPLLVLLRLERRGRRQGEPLRGRREQMQRHGGLLSTATATECGKVATATPSAPPSTATPSVPLTPAPTLSTAATAATRLLRRFSLLLPSPVATSSTASTTAATVQRQRPVQLWSRRLLWRGWGG